MKINKKVLFVFSIMPHYRLGIIRALLCHKEITSYFLFSNEDPRDIKKINLDSFEKFYLERFYI